MNDVANKKNGKAVVEKNTTPIVVETSKPTEEPKKVEENNSTKSSQEAELIRILNPSAEQRLKNLDQMQILGGKFKFLKTKEDELNKFVLSSDGTKEKISLSNASGFKFDVSNSQTIEKVLKVIEEDLKIFTERAEQEILQFTI